MSDTPTDFVPLRGELLDRKDGRPLGGVVVLARNHRGEDVVVVAVGAGGEHVGFAETPEFRTYPLDFIRTECSSRYPRTGCQVCGLAVLNGDRLHLSCLILGSP